MIGSLSGTLVGRTADGCVLEVGGVGYALSCSGTTLGTLPSEGGRCRLLTHLHVREDALVLFGFATESEKQIFEALLSVSGVGPKVAQALCSAMTAEQFRTAVATDDVAAIAAAPGIGKKTAQRIVIDLKEKLALPDLQVVHDSPDSVGQARSALENLGYSPAEVRAALADIAPGANGNVQEVIRAALKALA